MIKEEAAGKEAANDEIPPLLTGLSEEQVRILLTDKMHKDRLSTEIVKQRKLKERLNEELVRLVCESNCLYVGTQKNIFKPTQQFM